MYLLRCTVWLGLSLVALAGAGPPADPGPEPPGGSLAHDFKTRLAALAWVGGKQLILGGQDGDVRLWHLDTRKVETLKGHKKDVRSLAVSRDGKLLASAGDDPHILLWDVTKGKVLVRIDAPETSVRSLAFSPDSRTLAWVAADDRIYRCALPTGKGLPAFRDIETTTKLMSVTFSTDGNQLLVGGHRTFKGRVSSSTFKLFDAASGKGLWAAYNNRGRDEANKETADHPAPAAFSRDGKTWGGLAADDTLFTRREGQFYHTAGRRLTALAFSADSDTLIVAGRDGAVRFVQETKPKIAKQEGDTVYLAEPAKVREVAVLTRQGEVVGLALSPDGQRLAWVNDQGKVRVGVVSKLQKDNPARKK